MTSVDVEVVGLAGDTAGGLMYVAVRRALTDGERADDAARALVPEGAEVLHSTSWRQDRDGRLVLTYAAAPAHAEVMLPLLEPSVVSSGDPLSPAPRDVHAHHVAAHAARHLAYLLTRDPAVAAAAAASADPATWASIAATADIPTGTHRQVHRMAHCLAERHS